MLVLHLKDHLLRCHHCGHQERVPHACPSCGNTDLQPVGIGTQRVESALREHFPQARILRVDRDSEVSVLQQPFEIESGRALRGGDVDNEGVQARQFSVQITRKRRA